jgi:hypothetical protein
LRKHIKKVGLDLGINTPGAGKKTVLLAFNTAEIKSILGMATDGSIQYMK